MNTPAHAIFNLLVLGRPERRTWLPAIALGGVAPDLPMVWFYFWEKVVRKTPEAVIWGQTYFAASWQRFFDLFNSLPLIALGAALASWRRMPRLAIFFASMALHCLADLPLHNDDAHRHFYPFSDWRFESPVSYWDPQHSGLIVAIAEMTMVLGGSIFLAARYRETWVRALVALVFASYAVYLAYVLVVWV